MDQEYADRMLRQAIRWYILVCLNSGRPFPVAESLILSSLQDIPLQFTALVLRRELEYLATRDLIVLERHEGAPWTVTFTRAGIDVFEYTVPCEPGIARPKKY